MSFKLKTRTGSFPPGGWKFKDSKTGMFFGEEGAFMDVVAAIIKHRLANPRIYSQEDLVHFHFESVGNELSEATCSRLNNNPTWCESGELKPASTDGLNVVFMPRKCPTCGCAQGYEIICKTCSGRRITGYYCLDCKGLVAK